MLDGTVKGRPAHARGPTDRHPGALGWAARERPAGPWRRAW